MLSVPARSAMYSPRAANSSGTVRRTALSRIVTMSLFMPEVPISCGGSHGRGDGGRSLRAGPAPADLHQRGREHRGQHHQRLDDVDEVGRDPGRREEATTSLERTEE